MMINPDILVYIAILIMVIALILSIREFIREKRAQHSQRPVRGDILVPNAMIWLFADHRMTITTDEASLLLGYLEGHDYSIYVRPDGQIMRHDLDGCDGTPDQPYSIREILEFVMDMNEEFIKICERGEGSYSRDQLEHDYEIIDGLIERYYHYREVG